MNVRPQISTNDPFEEKMLEAPCNLRQKPIPIPTSISMKDTCVLGWDRRDSTFYARNPCRSVGMTKLLHEN